jgi:hypothetical protein
MAAPDKFEDLHLSDLSLEPLPDPNLLQYQPPKEAVVAKATAHPETRSKKITDRRINPDRRKVLRFEPDRRSGKDRRPRKSWEPGKNI